MLLEHSMLKPHSLISKINIWLRIFEFMNVCLYVCTHVVIWRYVYIYNYIRIYIRISVCMYVCMYVYICIYVSIHARVCVCTTIYTFDIEESWLGVTLLTVLYIYLCKNNYRYTYDTFTFIYFVCMYACQRGFDMFWSMSQIGSTMVSVCALGDTSWAN